MALAWYRKWRPSLFAEVVGQEHVISILRRALANEVVGHAYIFAGPRGVGKTTVARLLAKGVNCRQITINAGLADSCNACDLCQAYNEGTFVDVMEIDAASNRGIDDIRAIRDTVAYAPVTGRFKVYIIDEVHMLTKEAFNALLKTLEEPPSHVILILATTDIMKVPATILSRCQRFDFRPLSVDQVQDHLLKVAKAEKVKLAEDGARFLAEISDGSGRDALMLLQQLSIADQSLDVAAIGSLLGFIPPSEVDQVLLDCRGGDSPAAIAKIEAGLARGSDPEQFIRSVLHRLRGAMAHTLEAKWAHELSLPQLLAAADEWGWGLRHVRHHPEPALVLAAAVLKTEEQWARVKLSASEVKFEAPVVEQKPSAQKQNVPPQTLTVTTWQPGDEAKELWRKLIEQVRPVNQSLAALLIDAELLNVDAVEGEVVVGVHFPFHRARLLEIKNRRLLEDALSALTKVTCRLTCQLIANTTAPASDEELLASAQQIFVASKPATNPPPLSGSEMPGV